MLVCMRMLPKSASHRASIRRSIDERMTVESLSALEPGSLGALFED